MWLGYLVLAISHLTVTGLLLVCTIFKRGLRSNIQLSLYEWILVYAVFTNVFLRLKLLLLLMLLLRNAYNDVVGGQKMVSFARAPSANWQLCDALRRPTIGPCREFSTIDSTLSSRPARSVATSARPNFLVSDFLV